MKRSDAEIRREIRKMRRIQKDFPSENWVDLTVVALLTDVEIGYLSFEEAMMPFRIITLPGGEQIPLADYVEKHGKELSAGTADLLRLPA